MRTRQCAMFAPACTRGLTSCVRASRKRSRVDSIFLCFHVVFTIHSSFIFVIFARNVGVYGHKRYNETWQPGSWCGIPCNFPSYNVKLERASYESLSSLKVVFIVPRWHLRDGYFGNKRICGLRFMAMPISGYSLDCYPVLFRCMRLGLRLEFSMLLWGPMSVMCMKLRFGFHLFVLYCLTIETLSQVGIDKNDLGELYRAFVDGLSYFNRQYHSLDSDALLGLRVAEGIEKKKCKYDTCN